MSEITLFKNGYKKVFSCRFCASYYHEFDGVMITLFNSGKLVVSNL